MMTEVPWRSVDSASWTQLAGYGKIMVYHDQRLFVADVSEESSNRRNIDQHADHYPEAERDALMAALEWCGVTFEQVRTSYDVRAFVNMFMFDAFVRANRKHKGATVQQTLFAL